MSRSPARFKQADITRALAAVDKHGLTVSGCEIAPDGTIRILTGDVTPVVENDLDAWRSRRNARRSPQRA